MECDKRAFKSKQAARKSVANMHRSVRVYLCEGCGLYHVTKERYGFPEGKPRKRGSMVNLPNEQRRKYA